MVSATTFTLVGVVNKFITILLNVAIWDKHSSPVGLAAVCVCLLAGSAYQQAPKRDETRKQNFDKVSINTSGGDDSSLRLLEAEGSK